MEIDGNTSQDISRYYLTFEGYLSGIGTLRDILTLLNVSGCLVISLDVSTYLYENLKSLYFALDVSLYVLTSLDIAECL